MSSPIARARGRGIMPPRKFTVDWFIPHNAHQRRGHLAYIERADDTGGITISTTPTSTAVEFGLRVTRVGSDYFYDPGDSGYTDTQVGVKKTGRYRVTYSIIGEQTTTNGKSVATGVCVNGAAFASRINSSTGTMYCRHTNRPYGQAQGQCTVRINADDYVEVKCLAQGSAAGSVDSAIIGASQWGSSIMVELLADEEEYPGGKKVPEREGVIEKMVVCKGISGTSGNTTVDILKDGTSILDSAVTVASTQTIAHFGRSNFSDAYVSPGSYLEVNVTANESPPARDVFVQLVCAAEE